QLVPSFPTRRPSDLLPVTPLSAPEHHRTDRRMKPRFALFSALIGLAFGLLAGPVAGQRPNTVGIRPGEQCPAGMTEIRPPQCMADRKSTRLNSSHVK